MIVTVLICTYKRRELLENCLKSLIEKSQILPDEIVVVDGENGQINNIIEAWRQRFPNIVLVPTENINLAVARNKGIKKCNGDIIALTDDDIIVSPDWIKKLKQLHIENPQAGAVGGKIEPAGNRFLDRIANLLVFPEPSDTQNVRTLAGANISYKKEAVRAVGGFDEALFRGEDVDYNWRILQKGYYIHYSPQLVVQHYHRNSWLGLWRQIFMYGRAYYLVRKKWEKMYCVYPHGVNNFKSLLKAGYFFIGGFYQTFLDSRKIPDNQERFFSYPVLFFCQILWRLGIIYQYLKIKVKGI